MRMAQQECGGMCLLILDISDIADYTIIIIFFQLDFFKKEWRKICTRNCSTIFLVKTMITFA